MRYFLRALGIISIKSTVMITLSIVDLLFLARFVPVKVHALIMGIVLFLVTFLFAEWILWNPRITTRRFVTMLAVTFVWDTFLTTLLWSFFLADPAAFSSHTWLTLTVGFVLYAAAFSAAWFDRRRLTPYS